MLIGSVGNREKGRREGLLGLLGLLGPGALLVVVVPLVCLLASACGSSDAATNGPVTLRLGYFPNVTHGAALVGVQEGIFAKALGTDKLDASKTFNAGPAEATALISGAIDVAFIGPTPSINAFDRTNGAVQIIAGAASGGAGLVVKPSITSVSGLKGKTIATPQLGNTQDVALRAFLKSQGLKTDLQGGGDVSIQPQDNSQTLLTFKQGSIDGAWVPEPYLSQLVVQDGGHLLVNEKDLWPGGQWDTTNVLISTSFFKAHPTTVSNFLEGLVDTINTIKSDPAGAKTAINQQLLTLSGKKLPDNVLSAAVADLTFTVDPNASSLRKQASDAESVGLLGNPKLTGIFNLTILNQVLQAKGQPEVSS
jgi:NitT/TauT family transport system substrate-binding protein